MMEQTEYDWEKLADQDLAYEKENKDEYLKINKFFEQYAGDKEYEVEHGIYTTIYLTKERAVLCKADESGGIDYVEEYTITQEKKDMIFKALELLQNIGV